MTRTFIHRHISLVFGTLAMALVITSLYLPRPVKSVAKPVFIDPPVVTVSATTNNGITVTWDAVPGAVLYNIERSESMSGPFLNNIGISETSITDTEVSPHHAYVYRVRAIGPGNISSAPSNMAVGTAISFEFDKLIEEQNGQVIRHEVKARHLNDVRTAINAMRDVANMPPAKWARDNLSGLVIKATDVKELRDRLNEALAALQITPLPFDDPDLNTGANGHPVKAIHIEQLQERSTRGKSNSPGPLYSNYLSRAEVGEFSGVIDLATVPVHLSLLPDKRILFWGRDYALDLQNNIITDQPGHVKQAAGHSNTFIGSVVNQSFTGAAKIINTTTNLFCSGHSLLPDGTLLVTGGHRSPHFDAAGENHTNIFNYTNNSWTRGPDMVHGRWYPYNVTLSTGEALVMSGSYWSNPPTDPNYDPYDPYAAVPSGVRIDTNFTSQVYQPGTGASLKDLADPPGPAPGANEPARPRLTVYPYLHLTPDGRVFQAQSGFFNNPLTNIKTIEQQSRLLDVKKNEWTSVDDAGLPHDRGSSVLFETNNVRNVLLVGGFDISGTPTNGTEFFNLQQQTWTQVTPMRFQRSYHTATILPNGKVLVTGGVSCKGRNNIENFQNNITTCSAGQVMNPELWDPQTKTWSTMAPQNEVRAYHSVAALLPDGRVLVAGGGFPGAVGEIGAGGTKITDDEITDFKLNAMASAHANFEIFSPPYLFNADGSWATRPAITVAPPQYVADGETFFIGTSGAGSQPKVSLVRLPSVTHGFIQDQRQITIIPSLTNGGLNVTVPTSPNICPPGYYMLFVLNGDVPSEAAIIRVDNAYLFPTDEPETTATGDGLTWEQGIEFSSLINGQITHVRFWKAPGEPDGGHVGRIWNVATGTQLASVQFSNETASGWQEAQLATPLQVTAGTRYRVTYNANSVVAKTVDVMANRPALSWPLVGWVSYYTTPAGTYPTSRSGSNLFADVKFK